MHGLPHLLIVSYKQSVFIEHIFHVTSLLLVCMDTGFVQVSVHPSSWLRQVASWLLRCSPCDLCAWIISLSGDMAKSTLLERVVIYFFYSVKLE